METATTSYHGTQWRCVCGWKDTGGIDGVTYAIDLEWEDSDGIWHTDEAWSEEKRRPIPTKVMRWKYAVASTYCPYHKLSPATLKCQTCGTTLDAATV